MRILRYSEIVNLSCAVSDETRDRLIQEYLSATEDGGASESLRNSVSSLERQLSAITSVLGTDLRGKTLLDLGCGDPPWLCRFLHMMGARAIGVSYDIADKGERFAYHSETNLFEPNSLAFISDCSVDLANAHWLFDSPTRIDLEASRIGLDYQEFLGILTPQLKRILKPNGLFIHEEVERDREVYICEG